MTTNGEAQLSRRERQIMDAIYARDKATVNEVLASIDDPPSYSAVRALMRILEEKGHLKHTQKGRGFVYEPTSPRKRAGQSALTRVLNTFFSGSLEKAVTAHLADEAAELTNEELDRLSELIRSRKVDIKGEH